jgi:hypothetical protein
MSSSTQPVPTEPKRSRRAVPARVTRRGDWIGYLMLVGLLYTTWRVSQMGWYTSNSDTGYWMGVVGGIMMLILFLYPLRKRWRVLANVGKAKNWFAVHMAFGILGPVLVLAHSTFKIGSLNAGVALYSMLIVALSGVIGRFIYLRIHRGLGTELLNLQTVRAAIGFTEGQERTQLHFAPAAEARLRGLDAHTGEPGDPLREHMRRLVVLPVHMRIQRHRARREVLAAIQRSAEEGQWDSETTRIRVKRAMKLVNEYPACLMRVAQFGAYTRVFALWHLAHVPFVVVMVLCAVFHIMAVHVY